MLVSQGTPSHPSPHPYPLPRAVPPSIRWSAATAAFQVEGARSEDGRGRSIWDDYVETPGLVKDGSTAEPGPDSYHRSSEDVELARGLRLDSYRFGISWVRVLPEGAGEPNSTGLDYYSRLVDSLLEAGVTPFPTLYHWDLPVSIEAAGGWLSRDIALRFRDYVEIVAARLGDRVTDWYTVNEPAMTTLQGYGIGTLAPGRTEPFGALPSAHHQLLAHGLAAGALRGAGARRVGLTNNHTHVRPLTDSNLLLIIVVYTVFVVAASIIAGLVSDRIGRRRGLTVLAALVQAVSGIVIVISPTFAITMVAAALMGIGYGAFMTVGLAFATDLLPSERDHARDLGVVTVVAALGQLLGPVIGAGLVALVGGFWLVFAAAALLSVIGAGLTALARERVSVHAGSAGATDNLG